MRIPGAVFSVRNSSVPHSQSRSATTSKIKLPLSSQQTAVKSSFSRDLKTNSASALFSTKSRPDPKLLDFINAKCEKDRIKALNRLIGDDTQSDQRFFKPAKYEYDVAFERIAQNNTNTIADITAKESAPKLKK